MKRTTTIVLLTTLLGLSGTVGAVDSVLAEEQPSYQLVTAILEDELCAAVSTIDTGRTDADEAGESIACVADDGTDVTLAMNIRQRVESMIDWTIDMDSEHDDSMGK